MGTSWVNAKPAPANPCVTMIFAFAQMLSATHVLINEPIYVKKKVEAPESRLASVLTADAGLRAI
jgi:hypothetical protein